MVTILLWSALPSSAVPCGHSTWKFCSLATSSSLSSFPPAVCHAVLQHFCPISRSQISILFFHYHRHYRKFILLQGIHAPHLNSSSVSCSPTPGEGECCISPCLGAPEPWLHHLSQHLGQPGHQYYHYQHMKSKNLFRSTTGFHEVMLGLRGFFFFATTAHQGKTDATHRGEITDTNFWDC